MCADTQADNNRIYIFDTTLRDGEQSPGCSMNIEDKTKMAGLLDSLGVDIIEAGFPAASKGDAEAVTKIAETAQNATIAGLCRARRKDIDAAIQATQSAPKRRIHTFISTSPLHMQYKLKMDPEDVIEAIHDSVTYARNHCDDVEWSAEDGSRSNPEFLCRAVETALRAGAGTINFPDTVGYSTPKDYADLITMLRERVPGIDDCILSVHCHNDLGLAAANSLAGIKAGARQVECTINGIGERAGNAALEEIVMAMRTRPDELPYWHNIDTTQITRTSRTLSSITGFAVQPNKAIVGANAFAHESGIHQHGMLEHSGTYEIMTPESVGLSTSSLVLGKHSGRHAFVNKLDELGYDLTADKIDDVFARFKQLADQKKEVFEDDIIALIDDELGHEADHIRLIDLSIQAGTQGPQTASLTLEVEGEQQSARCEGNGPVDAIFKAIRVIYPHDDAHLQLYQVHAVTGGIDAQAEVTVRLGENGILVNGRGADTDTLVSSAKAYIHALNKLIARRERASSRPEDSQAEAVDEPGP
jgi:2-isopropylmalate synthase